MSSPANNVTVPALLQQHLQRRGIKLLPALSLELIQKAIASAGVGLDHTIGEHVLAIGDYSMHHDLTIFFMVTDRRVAGRRGRIFFHAPLAEIVNVVDRTNLVTANLKIHLASGQVADATVGSLSRPLGVFLSAVAQLHPSQRTPEPQPLPTPTAEELASVEWFNANRSNLNAVCEQMLWVVAARLRHGQIPFGDAGSFVRRIYLHNRATAFGRGMLNGWWLSPLTVFDLGQLLRWLLGEPVASYQQENMYTFDFLVGSSNTGRAVASSALGLAAAGLFGVGWVSMPGKSVKHIRVTISSGTSLTYAAIQGTNASNFEALSAVHPVALEKLLEALTSAEQSLLYRRALYGWQESPEVLMNKSEEELQASLATFASL